VSLFREKATPPSQQKGLTLGEWGALYDEAAQMHRAAQFRRAALVSGALLGMTILATVLTDGPRSARFLIGALGIVSLAGFTFSPAMIVGPWLLKRAGIQKSAIPQHGSHPRKHRR
jgi:hypothetical protein